MVITHIVPFIIRYSAEEISVSLYVLNITVRIQTAFVMLTEHAVSLNLTGVSVKSALHADSRQIGYIHSAQLTNFLAAGILGYLLCTADLHTL